MDQSGHENPIPTWFVGQHLPTPEYPSNDETVYAALEVEYDFITSNITNSSFRKRVQQKLEDVTSCGESSASVESPTSDEVLLFPCERITHIVAYTSSWLELDSEDPLIASVSKQVLYHEIAYAAFCGVSKVVVKGPTNHQRAGQFAEAFRSCLSINAFIQYIVEFSPVDTADDPLDTSSQFTVWDSWNTIRTVCNYAANIGISLDIPPLLPAPPVIDRWFAEPIRILRLSSGSFVLNGKGYPVLSKQHQAFLSRYMKIQPTPYILLADTLKSLCTGPPTTSTKGNAVSKPRYDEPLSFRTYIRHLQKNQPPPDVWERMGPGYQDYLQSPLQPLADNLESITYEVFEKDPVKYNQYEEAIKLALLDRDPASQTIVAVAGAGRGPLVSRALRAAAATGRNITLFAVEKNPNAFIFLQRHNKETWNMQVTLVKSDMRSWNPPVPIDILISELLGSFADNELSPECLDGVQRVLEPTNGVTIPTSYTAHFTPVLAPKIFTDLAPKDNDSREIPYVVLLHAIDFLAEKNYIQQAWEFRHPRPISKFPEEGNQHNTRYCTSAFKIPWRGVVHGLAGYFESVLYGNIEISTRPDTIDIKSPDMTSWFPIFFPLKTPLYLPDNSELQVTMWRETNERKVWYRWLVEAFTVLEGGKRVRLGLSEMHSSERSGCLM